MYDAGNFTKSESIELDMGEWQICMKGKDSRLAVKECCFTLRVSDPDYNPPQINRNISQEYDPEDLQTLTYEDWIFVLDEHVFWDQDGDNLTYSFE